MKNLILKAALWALRSLLTKIPATREAITDAMQSIDNGMSPIEVLARAVAKAIPGERDDRLVMELAEMPAKQWLATRGARIRLPGGRTVLQEYQALYGAVRGD